MEAQVTKKLSKYAAKKQKRLLDLRAEQEIEESQPEKPSQIVLVKDMVREKLFSPEGASAYHHGNPFAIAFCKELNRI